MYNIVHYNDLLVCLNKYQYLKITSKYVKTIKIIRYIVIKHLFGELLGYSLIIVKYQI